VEYVRSVSSIRCRLKHPAPPTEIKPHKTETTRHEKEEERYQYVNGKKGKGNQKDKQRTPSNDDDREHEARQGSKYEEKGRKQTKQTRAKVAQLPPCLNYMNPKWKKMKN